MTDPKQFGRVAVVMGGTSSEREISLRSGAAVLRGLTEAGVDAFELNLGLDGQQPIKQLYETDFDTAFLIVHGPGGEDGTLQGALELLEKPYTGSRVAASAIGMDKLRTKQLWQSCGIPTPKYTALHEWTDFDQVGAELGFPIMIKPSHEGSSIGMARVRSVDELEAAYRDAVHYDSSVLAESWISGPEYTVAVLNGRALPAIKLETTHEFYDYTAKYQANDTRYLFDTGLSQQKLDEMQDLVERAFTLIGCEGWGRIDLMLDSDDQFQLLEVNTAPGMTDHSLVPMAAKQAGMSFSELCLEILRGAR